MSETQAPETPEAPAPAPAPASRGRTFTRILAGLAGLVGIGNLVLLQALISQPFDASGLSMKVQALLVTGTILAAALLVPVGLGGWFLRTLRNRGVQIRGARTLAALVGLWNIVLLVGLLQVQPADTLLENRGTWLLDAWTGQGPYGEAAIPTVRTLAAEAVQTDQIGDLAPMLTQETAAGVALQWLVALDASKRLRKPGDPVIEKMARLLGKYDLDLEAVREDPTAGASAAKRGRPLLRDVEELVHLTRAQSGPAVQAMPTFSWPDTLTSAGLTVTQADLATLTDDWTITVIDRTHLSLQVDENTGLGYRAVYEDDAWRLELGSTEELVRRTLARLDQIDPLLSVLGTQSRPVDSTPPPDATPPAQVDTHSEVRAAFRQAAEGRYGMMTETTAFHAAWPDALTNEAAVSQAERFRTWCAAAAGEDLVFQEDHKNFATRYALGAPGEPVTNAQRLLLAVRGRAYLADVLRMCGPIVRLGQQRDATLGNGVPDKRRMTWASRDARDLAGRATITDPEPGRAKIEVDGKVVEAVMEDGAWRVHWPD